jgi:hypothetical protein
MSVRARQDLLMVEGERMTLIDQLAPRDPRSSRGVISCSRLLRLLEQRDERDADRPTTGVSPRISERTYFDQSVGVDVYVCLFHRLTRSGFS